MHCRFDELPPLGEGGTPQYPSDPAKIFRARNNTDRPKGAEDREIIRIGFAEKEVKSLEDKLPAKEVSDPDASSVVSKLNSTQTKS